LNNQELNPSQTVLSDFGPHLMMDCRQCDLGLISDVAYVFKMLNELPDAIGMTKITQPYVFPYEGKIPEDKGITGFVVIAESHLAFHSFVDKDYFFFDIFSCKDFDVQKVVDYIIAAFKVNHYEMHRVNRGRDFPRSVDELPEALPSATAAQKTLSVTTSIKSFTTDTCELALASK
jgi:S-adenosylmethionine decarboxylase